MSGWDQQLSFTRRFWVGCAVMLLSVSFIVVTLLQSNDARRLAASNVMIPATVVAQSAVGQMADASDVSYHLEYHFEFDGQRVSYNRAVPRAFFDTHPVGTTFAIRVNTADASLHDAYDGQTRNAAWGFLTVAILMAGVGTIFALSNGNLAALRSRFT